MGFVGYIPGMDFVILAFLLLPVALFKGALWAWYGVAALLAAPIVIAVLRAALRR
ncbi:hypothetical protein [Zoogloea sp.]|uniref:hypothetical protein n=1 Tax=Zoogloea sp. TaxID=49181 RepID=UPI0035AF03A4